MNPIEIEFKCTSKQLAEGVKAATRRLRVNQRLYKFLRWVLVCMSLLAIAAVVLTSLLPAPAPTRRVRIRVRPPPAQTLFPPNIVWPMVMISGLIWSYISRRLRLKRFNGDLLDKLQIVSADENGLRWAEPLTKTEYEWGAFFGFDETPNLFVLYVTDPKLTMVVRFRIVPKAALATPETTDQFRQLLTDRIHSHTRAFPVLPPKPLAANVPGDESPL
jgi:YcxB-like protein